MHWVSSRVNPGRQPHSNPPSVLTHVRLPGQLTVILSHSFMSLTNTHTHARTYSGTTRSKQAIVKESGHPLLSEINLVETTILRRQGCVWPFVVGQSPVAAGLAYGLCCTRVPSVMYSAAAAAVTACGAIMRYAFTFNF